MSVVFFGTKCKHKEQSDAHGWEALLHEFLSALLLFSWNGIGSIEKMQFGRGPYQGLPWPRRLERLLQVADLRPWRSSIIFEWAGGTIVDWWDLGGTTPRPALSSSLLGRETCPFVCQRLSSTSNLPRRAIPLSWSSFIKFLNCRNTKYVGTG